MVFIRQSLSWCYFQDSLVTWHLVTGFKILSTDGRFQIVYFEYLNEVIVILFSAKSLRCFCPRNARSKLNFACNWDASLASMFCMFSSHCGSSNSSNSDQMMEKSVIYQAYIQMCAVVERTFSILKSWFRCLESAVLLFYTPVKFARL